ncbi:MAG: hypothetical protein K6T94_10025 [Paenibacillus sp.]|nr:hypothetical protein [Paenibacillus sp.]
MENRGVYRVRHPSELSLLISLSLVMGINMYTIIGNKLTSESPILVLLRYGLIIFWLIILGNLIYRLFTFRRVIEIQIRPENIIMNNKIIDAKTIKTIFIKGYFRPVIGIRPKGNIMVPYKLCFRFLEKEDQGIKDLTIWAEQNQIKVANKRFQRWI